MRTKQLSESFLASPQLDTADIRLAAERGIGTIINNRPNQEESGQPDSDTLEAEAQRCGIAYHHIPVKADNIGDVEVAAMRRAVAEGPSPVLGFCGSGTRAIMLWALQAAGPDNVDELLAAARQAGYDLEKLRPTLEARARQPVAGARNAGGA